jgi:hypothetical protein
LLSPLVLLLRLPLALVVLAHQPLIMLELLAEIQYLEALPQLVVRLGVIQLRPEVLARVALTIVVFQL